MKIPFSRVANDSEYPIKIESEQFSVDATLRFQKRNLTMLLAHLKMSGQLKSICNSCGDEVIEPIDEEIEFLISDGVYNGFDDDFDVIEAIDGSIDLEEVVIGELELVASSYFHCGKCEDIDNKEF
jgi:uncharacterized metal-binding protein YceD (DUF177 family)